MKEILCWLRKRRIWRRIDRHITAAESDRARVAKMIIREAAYADALCGFLCHGFNHGKAVKITIEIDGTACEVGILATGNEPLMEYLANWAVGEKLKKMERLDEFYKAAEGGADEAKRGDLAASGDG